MALENCWEIKKCGREKGGAKAVELGICPAFPEFGHSCWGVTGTLCGGKVQGTFAQKEANCILCEAYRRYNRANGTDLADLKEKCPIEITKYNEIIKGRSVK